MPRFLTYNRVSTEGQVEGTSLDWQREQQVAWGLREGWQHIEDVFDGGQSGAKLDRAGLQRTLALLKDGRVDIVSFYKVDRAARAQRVFEDLWTAIYALDGRVFIHQKAKLYPTLDDLMDDTVWDRAMAEKERYSILSRSSEGLEQHIRAGSFLFRPLYGYFTVKERRDGINANVLRIDNEQARIIRRIVRGTINSESYSDISADLNARGYLSRRRVPWTYSSVQNVLRNRRYYAGLSFTKSRSVRKVKHSLTYAYPPIISADTLADLERAMALKPTGTGKAAPLRSSVRCSHCGAIALTLRARPGKGLSNHALYCRTYRQAQTYRRSGRPIDFPVCGHTMSANVVGQKLLLWLRGGGYEKVRQSLEAHLFTQEGLHLMRVRAVEKHTAERDRLETQLKSLSGEGLVRVARVLEGDLEKVEGQLATASKVLRAWEDTRELARAKLGALPPDASPLIVALENSDRAGMNEWLHRLALQVWVDFAESDRDVRHATVRVKVDIPAVPEGEDYEGYVVQ